MLGTVLKGIRTPGPDILELGVGMGLGYTGLVWSIVVESHAGDTAYFIPDIEIRHGVVRRISLDHACVGVISPLPVKKHIL